MSTNTKGFNGELTKIFFNYHQIRNLSIPGTGSNCIFFSGALVFIATCVTMSLIIATQSVYF